MVISPSFWRGKRVLITGHTGFKGGWLTLCLQSMGAEVSGYSLPPPTQPSFYVVTGIEDSIASVRGDVRNLPDLKSMFTQSSPEIVFHLAAQSLVRSSYLDPVETYSTNVMGTVNVLEAVRHCPGVRSVVIVTSDKCYENREWDRGYREGDAMGGYDPYSNSKGCAELVTSAFRNSFFNPDAYANHHVALASGRAGNVIGGGDWAEDRLLPDIIRAIVADQPVKIRNPGAIRPWQHVLEPLSGYLGLAQRLYEEGSRSTGGWNFGPADDDTSPVESIVSRITSLWGDGARWELDSRSHPHEARFLKLDCSKARSELGWQPRIRLETALAWTVDWYRQWHLGKDMRKLSLNQIATYCGIATK